MSNIAHLYIGGRPVSDANPLPTSDGGGGGGDVNVTQLGGAAISQTGGVQNVNATLVGTPTVTATLSGTPSVNATIVGTPTVTATLSGTPTVNVGQVGGEVISQTGGVQNVAVTNTLGLHPVNVTQLAGNAISQTAGVQNVAVGGTVATNISQLGGVAVSTQNTVAPAGIKGVATLTVRDDTRLAVEADTRYAPLRSDVKGALYVNADLRYVNGFSVAATNGNVPVSVMDPTTIGDADNLQSYPFGVMLAPTFEWNGVNMAYDRVRSVVSTFSAANDNFTTTVNRAQGRIVFGLTCNNSERVIKLYRIHAEVNVANDSEMNPLYLRLYKGIDPGSGDPIELTVTNHDNAFGGPNGNNLSSEARAIVYRSGAEGGGFTGGALRAGNAYVRRRFQSLHWDFAMTPPRQPLVLRGKNNGVVLVNALDLSEDYVLTVWAEWTEEVFGQAVP